MYVCVCCTGPGGWEAQRGPGLTRVSGESHSFCMSIGAPLGEVVELRALTDSMVVPWVLRERGHDRPATPIPPCGPCKIPRKINESLSASFGKS